MNSGSLRFVHLRRRLALSAAAPLAAILERHVAPCFGILMYHRVVRPWGRTPLPGQSVTAAAFDRQMRGLLARGYRASPLRQVLADTAAGRPIPPKTFVVTFDDGYECVYREAWPVLEELGIPATIFLPTAYLDSDGPFPFDSCAPLADRLPAAWWRPLSTAQCAEMQATGLVDLGTHTHTHLDFRGRPEAFRADVEVSLAVLRDRFHLAEVALAYPFGFWDAAVAVQAEEAGVLGGLTVHSDLVRPHHNRMTWGRFDVETYDTAATLAVKLDGWYSIAQNAWYWWRERFPGNGSVRP